MTWHLLTAEDAMRQANSSPSGMPKDSPKGQNEIFPERQEHFEILRPIVTAPLLILFAITSLAAFVANEHTVGVLSLVSLGFSGVLWYFLHSFSQDIIRRSKKKTEGFSRVIRDGTLVLVANENLVRGDVILLQKGDYIPADCRVLSGDPLAVRESAALSGKACDHHKNASPMREGNYEDADNMLWAGSAVLSGSARALVAEVGEATRLALFGAKRSAKVTPFVTLLKKISFALSSSLIGFLFLTAVFAFTPLSHGGLFADWLLAVSLAGGAMSEFLVLIYTAAVGNMLFQSKRMITRRAETVETLARIDTVFLRAELFHDTAADRLSAFLLPDGRSEPLVNDALSYETALSYEIALSYESARILRNAMIALGGDARPASQEGLLYGERGVGDLVFEAFQKNGLSLRASSFAMLASGETESGISYGVFRRGERLLVSLFAELSTLLPLCRFVYRSDAIAPLSNEEGMRLLASASTSPNEKVYGVAIGFLSDDAPDALEDSLLDKKLFDTLVYEGACRFSFAVTSPRHAAKEFSDIGVSTVLLDGRREEPSVKTLPSPTRREILDAILREKEKGKTVLLQGEALHDLALMKEADLSFTLADAPPRNEPIAVESESPLLVDGVKATRLFADWLLLSKAPDAISAAIVSARTAFYRTALAISYLLTVLGAKLVFVIASLVSGKTLATPILLFLLGMGFDTLAVFALLLKPCRETKKPYDTGRYLRHFLSSLGAGVLSGGAFLVFTLLAGELYVLSLEVFSSVLVFAFSLFVFLTHYVSLEEGKRPKAALSLGSLLIVFSAILLFVLIFTRGSFGKGGFLFLSLALLSYLAIEGVKRLVLWLKDTPKSEKRRIFHKKIKKIHKKSDKTP